jgi:hypothetical protein
MNSSGCRRSSIVIELIIALILTSSLSSMFAPFGKLHPEHRHLREDVLERPELLNDADLLEEVLHVELALEHPHRVLLGLLGIDDLLEVLHQAHDVAHTEDAARQSLGTELLDLVEALTDAEEADRLPRHFAIVSAAPPRASPSSLVRIKPVVLTRSWNAAPY